MITKYNERLLDDNDCVTPRWDDRMTNRSKYLPRNQPLYDTFLLKRPRSNSSGDLVLFIRSLAPDDLLSQTQERRGRG